MNYLRAIIFVFILLVTYQTAFACDCGNTDSTILGNFEQSDLIVIAKVVSVEEVPKTERRYAAGERYAVTEMVVKSTKMIVEKVYKGNLKVGEEMIFGQGQGGGSCLWEFYAHNINERFLLYLKNKDIKQTLWLMNICSRSTSLSGNARNGADDLLFLKNLDTVINRTRLSGTVFAVVFPPIEDKSKHYNEYRVFPGLKVRILGNGNIFETTTNENGIYEIYDLPEGVYKIQPDIPNNWKIDIYGGNTIWFGGREAAENLQVTLKAKKHAFYDFHLDLINKVSGKVFDPSGNPIEGVCPQLIAAQGVSDEDFVGNHTNCTKNDGSFEIKGVPQGNYKLVVNRENEINSRYPFNTVYYPNVKNFENATVINIADAESVNGIEIHIPEIMERITVNGIFTSSDGVPVEHGTINFVADKINGKNKETIWTKTDKNGKFSIRLLKGLEGKLSGSVNSSVVGFEGCPDLTNLIFKENNYSSKISSNVLTIKAVQNFEKFELRLPFQSCKKNRIINRSDY